MIQVDNITKSYGNQKAVDGVSFQVNSGEVVGLLGPNGAGKTTTLNMITGVLIPEHGEVKINELSMQKSATTIKKQVGYLAEDNPLYQTLLVSESMQITAELKGLDIKAYQKSLNDVVPSTGIKDIFYKPIDSLSKGLRQRVGLAQALLGSPSVLILDEPTEGLDPNQRQEIRELIRHIGEDRTVLLSSHVMQEVEALCERVVILNNGRVVTESRVDEITNAKEGIVQIEIVFGGSNAQLPQAIRDRYPVNTEDNGRYEIEVAVAEEDQFYRSLNTAMQSGEIYLTELIKKRVNLEDVFRKLTTEE